MPFVYGLPITPGRELGMPVSLIVLVGITVGVVSKTILVGVNCAVSVSVAVGTIEVAPVEGNNGVDWIDVDGWTALEA